MPAIRWCGTFIGLAALLTGVTVASVFVTTLAEVDQDAREALIAIFVSIAVGITLGAGLLYVSRRAIAKIVLALLSVYLITGGFLLMVIAPVLRQMNTPDLAEYRAFAAFEWFGALSIAAGIALAVVSIRWALRPQALRRIARWSRLLGSGYGVMQGISGVLGLFLLLSVINGGSGDPAAQQAIALTTIAMLSLVPGLILTYHGISASMGEGSGEFRPPVALWALVAYAAVLVAGGLVMASTTPIAAPMPALHVLAAALPGVTLVAMASRGGTLGGRAVRFLTWRQVTLAMAISMAVGTAIALYVESLGSLGAILLMLVHNGAFEFARDSSDVNDVIRNSRFILTRNEQFVANLITAAVLAPLAEEFSKGLGVRFMMRRETTRLQAFVLGAAAGAAFGFLEAMLYGLAGIDNGLGYWWLIMLVRGGSTTLHVFNTALVGLAWWYWSIGGKPRRALVLFAAAVCSHAVWNGFAVMLDSRIFGIDTLDDHLVEGVAYTFAGAMAIGYVIALPLIARGLRAADDLRVADTQLAAMAPWLA